jgi:hypothetical protein
MYESNVSYEEPTSKIFIKLCVDVNYASRIPHTSVCLEKLTVVQIGEKFSVSYEIRKFITVRHVNSVHTLTSCFFDIYFNIFLLASSFWPLLAHTTIKKS